MWISPQYSPESKAGEATKSDMASARQLMACSHEHLAISQHPSLPTIMIEHDVKKQRCRDSATPPSRYANQRRQTCRRLTGCRLLCNSKVSSETVNLRSSASESAAALTSLISVCRAVQYLTLDPAYEDRYAGPLHLPYLVNTTCGNTGRAVGR
jgi:hypothetical protein